MATTNALGNETFGVFNVLSNGLTVNGGNLIQAATVLFSAGKPSAGSLSFENAGYIFVYGTSHTNLMWSGFNNTFAITNTATNNLGIAGLNLLTTGSNNVALGTGGSAGSKITTGSYNVLVGINAGHSYTSSESSNISINTDGTTAESNTLRIGSATGTGNQQLNQAFISGIYGITTTSATTSTVLVSNGNQLGTISSSYRFKNSIKDMGSTSDAIMKLRPVTFHYNAHKDNVLQYGLVAEEVNEIMPGIVNLDDEGKPFSVRYHDLVPMLLNELQKLKMEVKKLKGDSDGR